MSFSQPVRDRRVVIIGFGLVGPAIVPLLVKDLGIKRERILAISANEDGSQDATRLGIKFLCIPLTRQNYGSVLADKLTSGDWLINVSVDVSSLALIDWAQENGIHYLDTCIEPWAGGYESSDVASTTNYDLRRQALDKAAVGKPTAIIAHGANPGLITHIAKEGLLKIAAILGHEFSGHWGELAERCGVRVVQIAEKDSQQSADSPNPNTFFNTWSVTGFLAELDQRAEIGWGTHEAGMPAGAAEHELGDRSAIYLESRGCETVVKSWVPGAGPVTALAIPHHEASSLASLFSVHHGTALRYRPTVYYAYDPAPAARASISLWKERGRQRPECGRVLRDELTSGSDDLGVLFLTTSGGFWYGSRLSLSQARQLAPCNTATSLQVAAGIIGALTWLGLHPEAGVVEAENIDHQVVMSVARPYLGELELHATHWMPGEQGNFRFEAFVEKNMEGM